MTSAELPTSGASLGEALRADAARLDRPVWAADATALSDLLRELARLQRLLGAQAVEVAVQAQERGLRRQQGSRHLRDWVRAVLPIESESDVSSIARRAEVCYTSPVAAELAQTRDAFLTGVISGAQADVISSTVSQLLPPSVPAGTFDDAAVAEGQALLLREARALDPKRQRRHVDGQVVWSADPPDDTAPTASRATAAVDDLVRRWVAVGADTRTTPSGGGAGGGRPGGRGRG